MPQSHALPPRGFVPRYSAVTPVTGRRATGPGGELNALARGACAARAGPTRTYGALRLALVRPRPRNARVGASSRTACPHPRGRCWCGRTLECIRTPQDQPSGSYRWMRLGLQPCAQSLGGSEPLRPLEPVADRRPGSPSRERLFSDPPGRIAQRESARFTRGRSLVRSQVRPSPVALAERREWGYDPSAPVREGADRSSTLWGRL